jgi:hypothetical protein
VPRALHVGFPAGDAVQLGGWDGIVVVEEGTPFVPQGASAWELGVSRDVRGKANTDYETRRANPRGIDPATSSFVFVTPRRWMGKAEWVATRQGEGVWREVRAYDADDLEAWLELAPAVHVWFSIAAGKHPEHTTDLGTEWADWAEVTRPPTTTDLVLSGRGDVAERIRTWLGDPSGPLVLHAESRDEALAVFAAAVHQLPPEARVEHLSRALVVRDIAAWHHLAASPEPLILVPLFDSREGLSRAERGGHRIVIPLGGGDSVSANTLTIPRLSTDAATAALVTAGMSEERARDLALLARRSLSSFRRKVAVSPEVQQPEWARPMTAGPLLPVMLAGSWNDAVESDRLALSALAQTPYDEVARSLVRWSNEADPPVRRVGGVWMVVSGEDAWDLLGRYLTRDHLGRLETVALDVLATSDPQFDLSEDQRWMAGALGVRPRHSQLLREGLAEMLAVMGSRGGSTMVAAGESAADHAGRIVRRVLDRANTDWRVWASLSPVLPRLAEAAPDAFLAAVDAGLGGEMPILRLFGRDGDPLFSSSPHTGLLWALETVAWDAEHLSHAALLLARLARLDPGGRLQNRPQNSLRSIFLLWHPQTAALLDRRLRVLDLLIEREPEVSWQLLRQLLPEHHGIGHNNPRPRLREWAPDSRQPIMRGEHFNAVTEVVTRMLAGAGARGARWHDLISAVPNLQPSQRGAVVDRLAGIDSGTLESHDRAVIWEALRQLVARHRSFSDAEWALPPKDVDELEALYRRFLPTEPAIRYGWLFSDHPELPEGRARDWKAQEDALDKARLEAVQAIFTMGGLAGLTDLARQVARPDQLGVTIGRSELLTTEEDDLLAAHLASADAAQAQLAHGFAAARAWSRGHEWAQRKLQVASWSVPQRAEFLTCFSFGRQTWTLAEAAGAETETAYWHVVRPFMVGEDLDIAVSKLLAHGRPYTATHLLSMAGTAGAALPTPAFILNTLERAAGIAPEDDPPSGHFAYELGELLDLIEQGDEVDEGRVAAIEWAFLPVFGRHERKPRVLHRELARNPRFFAELVALAYRAEGEEPRELSEQDQMRAHHAHDLLDSWRVLPGSDGHHVDAAALTDWMRQAREAMAATGRGPIGDELIGQLLSGAPAGEGGAWPHPAVCGVIESAASADLERGVEVGVYNGRGMVTKHPFEGGGQERQLAERYAGSATALSDRCPRTAALLRRLADGYRAEAQREDERAELREDRGR